MTHSGRSWCAVCPSCGCGFFCSTGREFELIVRRHRCREGEAA